MTQQTNFVKFGLLWRRVRDSGGSTGSLAGCMLCVVMRWLRVFPLGTLLLVGCVYFNTMYNAQRYFRMGEVEYRKQGRLTAQARQYYQKAVEKAAKIVKYHPRSRYVPEALYIMAVAFSRMDEREKARRKFEELATYYPKEAQRFHIYLELGRLALLDGNFSLAREYLQRALQQGGEQAEEAAFLLAQTYAREGNDAEALKRFREFLDAYPRSRWRKPALFEAAKAAFEAHEYPRSVAYLEEYLKMYTTREEEKSARLLLAEALLNLHQLDRAREILESLDLPPADRDVARRDVLLARVFLAQGDTAHARSTLQEVAQRARQQEAGIEARYRLGLLLESRDSLEAAYNLYREASQGRAPTPFRDQARRRMLALSELQSIDSTRTALDLYRVAELYLFELQREDEAARVLKDLLRQFPHSEYAPKALYTLTYLYAHVRPNTDSARKYFQELVQDFGTTLYAREAQKRFAFLSQEASP